MIFKRLIKTVLTIWLFTELTFGSSIVTTDYSQSYAAPTLVWNYKGEGSPKNWGQFSSTCSIGKNQSPIDIINTDSQDLTNPFFHYQPSKLHILNNGRTIRINYDRGSYLDLDGETYDVKQFHYHTPSEHSINGKLFPAELHIVHEKNGDYAVVGILLAEGETDNSAYQPVIDNLPAGVSPQIDVGITINAAELLPSNRTTYRYSGSLTTPPCTEGVNWFLMTTPVQLSSAQIASLTTAINGNNRPVQPVGTRKVVRDNTL